MSIDGIKASGNTPSRSDITGPKVDTEQKASPAPETRALGDSSSISDEAYEVPDSDKDNYLRIGTDDKGKSFIDSWNIEDVGFFTRSGGRRLTVDEDSYNRKELTAGELENLQINTGDGNDYVEIMDANGQPMTINLGEGNDFADALKDGWGLGEGVNINGGGGNDTIFSYGAIDGGEGDDKALPDTPEENLSNVESKSKSFDGGDGYAYDKIESVQDSKGNEV